MHFTRAGARLNILVHVTRTRANSQRDSNAMGFHDVQTSRRFSFAHNPRALWSTLCDNGRSRMYAKNRSVFTERPRDAHPSRGNRQVSMAVTYASAAIENATSIGTRSFTEIIVAFDSETCNRCDVLLKG